MIKTDVHQHLWSAPLLDALSERSQLPFIRREQGLAILYLAGEPPYVIDLSGEAPARRAALVERDGLDRALVCVSSPLGIESLPREQSLALLDAYHEGALSLADPFAVWGAIALERPDADDVDVMLNRGCVGLSLPAGALAGVDELSRLHAVLARLELRGAPLFVHPGPGTRPGLGTRGPARPGRLDDPLWWPALTRYVADMHAAWLAFLTAGRLRHPRLRVIFSMLAGLAPLHAERLSSRGGPAVALSDPLVFYDTSSYGASTARLVQDVVRAQQVLYGSDRPVVEPGELGMPGELDWDPVADGTDRALASLHAVPAR
jgi:6-methylsalicylate decarboxylase